MPHENVADLYEAVDPYPWEVPYLRSVITLACIDREFYDAAGRHLDHAAVGGGIAELALKAAHSVAAEIGHGPGDAESVLARLSAWNHAGKVRADEIRSVCGMFQTARACGLPPVDVAINEVGGEVRRRAVRTALNDLSRAFGRREEITPEMLARVDAARQIGKVGAAGESTNLEFVDWREITIPDREDAYLLDGVIYREGVHMIAGQPFGCKSRTMAAVVVAVSTGSDVLGRRVRQTGRTLWISGEHRAAELPSRLTAVARGLGFADGMIQCDVVGKGAMLDQPAVRAQIEARLASHDYAMVVIDSLRSTSSAKENDNDEMAAHLSWCSKLATGRPVVIVHHSAKAGDDVRGAGDIRAKLDSLIIAKKGHGEGNYKLKVETRDAAPESIPISITHTDTTMVIETIGDGASLDDAIAGLQAGLEADRDAQLRADILEVVAGAEGGATLRAILAGVTGGRERIKSCLEGMTGTEVIRNSKGRFEVAASVAGRGGPPPPPPPPPTPATLTTDPPESVRQSVASRGVRPCHAFPPRVAEGVAAAATEDPAATPGDAAEREARAVRFGELVESQRLRRHLLEHVLTAGIPVPLRGVPLALRGRQGERADA